MSSTRVEVLLWANRIVAKKSAEAHQLLEIQPEATVDQAQEAFHKIARIAHPDLHRTTLNADELELVTSAYAQVANAYQQFRSSKMQTTKLAAVKQTTPPDTKTKRGGAISLPGGGVIRGTGTTRPPISTTSTPAGAPLPRSTTTPPMTAAASPAPGAPAALVPEPSPPAAAHASGQMNSKALIYYRKAELALRQGDLRAATLNLKMAIAADTQSTFLRSALSEVEAEVGKKP